MRHCDFCRGLAIVAASSTKLAWLLEDKLRQVLCESCAIPSTNYADRGGCLDYTDNEKQTDGDIIQRHCDFGRDSAVGASSATKLGV